MCKIGEKSAIHFQRYRIVLEGGFFIIAPGTCILRLLLNYIAGGGGGLGKPQKLALFFCGEMLFSHYTVAYVVMFIAHGNYSGHKKWTVVGQTTFANITTGKIILTKLGHSHSLFALPQCCHFNLYKRSVVL